MKYILYFMMMIYGSLCHAIVCKHIVEISETNTRKVHQIRRDALGYMWFMSHTGISRFDGTKLKHYKLSAEGQTVDYYMGCCRLLTDKENGLWAVPETEIYGRIIRHWISLSAETICRTRIRRQCAFSVQIVRGISGFPLETG